MGTSFVAAMANAVSSSDQPKISVNMKSLGVRPKSWVIMVDKNGA